MAHDDSDLYGSPRAPRGTLGPHGLHWRADYIDAARQKNVSLIATDELSSLMETAHLLRSPENASRLLASIRRSLT